MTISIDDDVEMLTEQIHALKQLGEKESVNGNELYDVSIRWGTALAGRLPRMIHYSALGELSDADAQRFHSLCDDLRAVSPLAAKFGLVPPALPESSVGSTNGEAHG